FAVIAVCDPEPVHPVADRGPVYPRGGGDLVSRAPLLLILCPQPRLILVRRSLAVVTCPVGVPPGVGRVPDDELATATFAGRLGSLIHGRRPPYRVMTRGRGVASPASPVYLASGPAAFPCAAR